MTSEIDGLLLVDKPAGPTSHDVVDEVRRVLGQRRVGHTGTLDPFACGLLPIVLGRATRLARFLPDSPKRYEGLLRFGVTTTTDDATGEVLTCCEAAPPAPETVRSHAAGLEGRIRQVPPAFSAKKVAGRRLHALARQGRAVSAAPVDVVVRDFRVRPTPNPREWRFTVEVSAGTYVRALARDLGAGLGCGGILVALERLAIGPMRLSEAVRIEAGASRREIASRVVPPERMPLALPSVEIGESSAIRFLAGNPVAPFPGSPRQGACRVFGPSGDLLGVAEVVCGMIRPRVVLFSVPDSGTATQQ